MWTILETLTEAPRKIKVIQLTTISVSSALSSKYYECGGISVRGSRSIPQGFLKVGSNFVYLGTPPLNAGNSGQRRTTAIYRSVLYHANDDSHEGAA